MSIVYDFDQCWWSDRVMNNNKNNDDSLPDGWVLCQSKSVPGRTYYFQRRTGKSLWTKPEAKDKVQIFKKSKIEKNRPEETEKKSLKRKSDSCLPEASPKKRNNGELQQPSPPDVRHKTPVRHQQSPSSVPAQNSANKRLQQLRKQIAEELVSKDKKHDEQSEKGHPKSPVKHKRDTPKPSPKTHTEVPNKISKTGSDHKSPTLNESRCSTNLSPSSDSLQSSPSPSQFFTANKILSSMKAQLPEQYCNQMKAKDTFADINHAICTQTPEYPSMKHPATPPQFSEASKIVSAIKSKLSYNPLVSKDSDVTNYSSAKDRMDVLRKRLSYEVDDKGGSSGHSNSEAMEVEEYKESKPSQSSPQKMQYTNTTKSDDDNVVLVVDTNVFIHELDVIKKVLNSHIKSYAEQPTLLVPWRVINELDRLKDNNNGNGAICKRARAAMDYLYQSLPKNNRIKGQSLRDANSHIYPCELPDDEILNCSLQQAERGKSVILLSNDKNLCNKAIINGVKSIGLNELKTQLENKVSECSDPDLQASLRHYETSIYQLLANILENEMRDKYKSLWHHVVFKEPPWSLRDVLQCLLKHWLAVFSELFPRIEHLITDLSSALHSLHDKDPKALTNSEVENFKELSLEVARKCQIIPEYMELAKQTVEGITRGGARDDAVGGDVIASFEQVWTVLSAYCAKLASGLGISHSVEDKINSQEPLSVLTSKWSVFSSQIFDMTNTIKGVLDASSDESSITESLNRLQVVLKESLTIINVDPGVINQDNLRLFCTKNRNMLQEAFTKFAALTELLDVCRNVMTK